MSGKRKIVEYQGGVRKSARIAQQNGRNASFLTLNDDCLLHIFSFLDLKSRAKLEMVSKRIRNLVHYSYRFSIYRINSYDFRRGTKSPASFECLASKVGPYVDQISLDYNVTNFADIFPTLKFFTNLKTIDITELDDGQSHNTFKDPDHQKFLASASRTVEKLKFSGCALHNEDFKFFLKESKLKYLSFYKCRIEGNWFVKLKNLETLQIDERFPYGSQFRTFCKNNTNLKTLELYGKYGLPFDSEAKYMAAVFTHLKNLETFTFKSFMFQTDMKRYNKIINLQKLKHLKIINGYNLNRLLGYLATHDNLETLNLSESEWVDSHGSKSIRELRIITKFTKLKRLSLKSGSVTDEIITALGSCETLEVVKLENASITDEGAAQFIIKCKNLKYIDLRSTLVTDDLITTILPELESRSHQLRVKTRGSKIFNQLKNRVIYCCNLY